MNWYGFLALCGLSAVMNVGFADTHHHHNGAGFKPNASHQVHANVAGHSIHANTNGLGKVSSMHAQVGGMKVGHQKVVKAGRKHVGLGANGEFHFTAMGEISGESECSQGVIAFIGFYFNLGGNIYIFWFPVSVVGIDPANCENYP